MKDNANEPINPIRGKMQGETDYRGLTKREYFAGLAMRGLLGSGRRATDEPWKIAESAVKQADYIISELAKEK